MSSSARRPRSGGKPKDKDKVVPALVPASRIKRKLREHLRELGFVRASNGDWCNQTIPKNTIELFTHSIGLSVWIRPCPLWSNAGRSSVATSHLVATYILIRSSPGLKWFDPILCKVTFLDWHHSRGVYRSPTDTGAEFGFWSGTNQMIN